MTTIAPQLIFLAFAALALGIGLAEHGTPKKGKNSIIHTLIGLAISQGLLYWGGFYAPLLARLSGR